MKRIYFLLTVLFLFPLLTFGQQTPKPTAAATPEADNEVVRITTKLVQLDIIVVDKDGKQVRNLTADDFEVLQDGKPQKITDFSYVNTEAPKTQTQKSETSIPVPPVKTVSAARIVTFVVDDGTCSASSLGVRASREGIEKFVREQMQPNDIVAIYRTRAGSSMLQQYTSDKAQLLKTAATIQWRPPMGSCASMDGSMFEAAKSNTYVKPSPNGTTMNAIESNSDQKIREHVEDAQQNNSVVGTLGVLRYIIKGLQRIPGRKVVFFMSDGIPLRERDGRRLDATDVLRDVTDLANRSSVIFNTIDARGVTQENMVDARDEIYAQDDINASNKITSGRAASVSNSRDGLAFLARETGGEFYREQNFLDVPIGRALERETGYYLIAYDPEDETFKGKKFNKLEVKVKQPGLKVVSRAGFFGVVDESATTTKRKTADSELYEAITAPLPVAGMNLQLTAMFVNSVEAGDVVRALIHIEGKDITFTDEPDGFKKAVFDVVAVTMDEKGNVVDEFTKTHTYKVDARAIPMITQNGLIYSTDVSIKKAGTYNFRVAVRDETSKQIGSSSQLVEIPDLKKSSLYVSGMTVAQVDSAGKFAIPTAVIEKDALAFTSTMAVPAIRRFKRGSILAYAYTVYNAKVDPATGQPNLSVQTKLFHNGKVVIDGKPQASQLEKQLDWTRINDYSYIRLMPQMEAGDYTLQIIIKDLSAPEKNSTATQSVDFEVVD